MIWRWVLVVLVVLNIGLAGWLGLHQHARVLPPLTDPGTALLELLPAHDQSAAPAPAASSGVSERRLQDTTGK